MMAFVENVTVLYIGRFMQG
jgi:hypothetical protein